MDTAFTAVILVLFIVIAGLAIDVGYLYIGEDELVSAAEKSALAGVQSLHERLMAQLNKSTDGLENVLEYRIQSSVRTAAVKAVHGSDESVSLVGLLNDKTNILGRENDITVGFWNYSSNLYSADKSPVNAIQVRPHRTAESEAAGIGSVGTFFAKLSDTITNSTPPLVTAALKPQVRVGIALPSSLLTAGKCEYPEICTLDSERFERNGWKTGKGDKQYSYTTLNIIPEPASETARIICSREQPRQSCGKPVFASSIADETLISALAASFQNPETDSANKVNDPSSDKVSAWWQIVPLLNGSPEPSKGYQLSMVDGYALVRIVRICSTSDSGCKGTKQGGDYKPCKPEDSGIYIDRLSVISCTSESITEFPGLDPVIVR